MNGNISSTTFSEINFVKLKKEEKDYRMVATFIHAAAAFARINYQCVYIFDYYKNNFLYLSENPLFLCGRSVEYVMRAGFGFFIDNVPPREVPVLAKIHQAGFRFFNQLSASEKLNHHILYNFHLKHSKQEVLINNKMTPIVLDETGAIWLAMGIVSMASENNACDAEIRDNRSFKRYHYNELKDEWELRASLSISPREKEIILLSALGMTNKEISVKLDLTEAAIKFHRSKIFKKIGVNNIAEAISRVANNMKL